MPDNSMTDKLLTPEEVASNYRQSVATLATWRCRGGGPRFVKLGRRILYRETDLAFWVDQNSRAHTSEAA
jgi:Helix-turn-helix domain